MNKILLGLALLVLIAAPGLAGAQSSPGLTYGQVPTAAQWNSYFAAKQDYGTTTHGTVLSVGLSAPSFLSVTGSPVTSTGTLALGYSGVPLPIGNGGTGANSAGIGALNNITGQSYSGFSGSGNLAGTTAPTLSGAILSGTTTLPGSGQISSGGLLGIGMTPTNVLDITQNQNGSSTISLLNNNGGTGASSAIQLLNGTSASVLVQFGSVFTSGTLLNRANGTLLQSNGAGGLTLSSGSTTPLYFGVGGAEVAKFDTSGRFLLGYTSDPSGGTALLSVDGGAFFNSTLAVGGALDSLVGASIYAPASNSAVLNLHGRAGVNSDNVQLSFFGQKDGYMWSSGSDIVGNGSTKDFEFYSHALSASVMTLLNGLQVGSPTGGDKGFGTINASAGIFTDAAITQHTSGQLTAGTISRTATAGVAGSPAAIAVLTNVNNLVLVTGQGSGAIFSDLLMCGFATGTATVVSSTNQQGSPATRTYTLSSGTLSLQMGSATAMQVSALVIFGGT